MSTESNADGKHIFYDTICACLYNRFNGKYTRDIRGITVLKYADHDKYVYIEPCNSWWVLFDWNPISNSHHEYGTLGIRWRHVQSILGQYINHTVHIVDIPIYYVCRPIYRHLSSHIEVIHYNEEINILMEKSSMFFRIQQKIRCSFRFCSGQIWYISTEMTIHFF